MPSNDIPLKDVAEIIFSKLEKDRYVAIPGGYFNTESGHAMFYEFILEKDQTVTFKATNSGDGLEYHPVDLTHLSLPSEQRCNRRYRTLVFTGASCKDLGK